MEHAEIEDDGGLDEAQPHSFGLVRVPDIFLEALQFQVRLLLGAEMPLMCHFFYQSQLSNSQIAWAPCISPASLSKDLHA